MSRNPTLLAVLSLFSTLLPIFAAQDLPAQERPAQDKPALVVAGAPMGMRFIDKKDLRKHAFFLASDDLGGRYTGTVGQREAARYLADHLQAMGYAPLGDVVDGKATYFQNWPVQRTYLDKQNTWLRVGEDSYYRGFGVMPGTRVSSVDLSGELIWCGSGRKSALPEGDLADKIPVVMFRSRKKVVGAGVERQFMMAMMALRNASTVARRLAARGAKGVVILGLDDDSGIGDFINYAGVTPQKHLLSFQGDSGMAGMGRQVSAAIPMVFASRRLSEKYMSALAVDVDEKGKPYQSELESAPTGVFKVDVQVDPDYRVPNVCAFLEGSDKKDEAVVFSAHMDHMGVRLDGEIFNGADDNASGSAALLEVAEAIARGDKPRRSVIILYVAGEELGLWGSKWYSDNPTWDLDKIVADVNIDMIGRDTKMSGADEVAITPSFMHKMYSSTARDAAKIATSLGLGLVSGDKFYARSDHYNFAVKGVPVVFFTDGEHRDYHQVTDHPDKLDYDKIEKVAKLAYWAGFNVAMQEDRPETIGRVQGSWQGEPKKKKQ